MYVIIAVHAVFNYYVAQHHFSCALIYPHLCAALYTLYCMLVILHTYMVLVTNGAYCYHPILCYVCVYMNVTTIVTKTSASASLLKDLLLAAEEGSLRKVQSFLDGGRCRVNDKDEVCIYQYRDSRLVYVTLI